MRIKGLKLSIMFVVVIALGAAAGACGSDGNDGSDGNECAPGTVEVDGQCVPFCSGTEYWNGSECVAGLACAPGTVEVGGQCVPFCSDTEYWNGTDCVSAPACAAGTVLNATTGECEPACADGTYWTGTACADLPTCGDGTEFNVATSECEALCAPGTFWDTTTETCLDACGEGTVLSDGVCLPWIDVVESDSVEPAENNDAMMGGMPGMLTVPAIDVSTVLEGIIDSPTDLDGDGHDDADYDTWYFSATQGTRLRIEGWADGVFNVATLLIGASEDESNWWYQRYGLNPDSPESERDFVIPMDGEYLLAVTDFSNLTGDIPVGGPEMGYFVNITQVLNPDPIAGTAGTPQTGSAFDIDQVTYTGTAGELWDVTIDSWGADTYGIMAVHKASGDFMQQLEGVDCSGSACQPEGLTGGLKFTMPMADDGGIVFTADYKYRSGSGGDYGFTVQPNPNVEVLDVDVSIAVHNEDLLSSEGEIIYQIDVVGGNLYRIAFENLGTDVTASLYATLHDFDFNILRDADTEYDEAPWEFNIYAEVDARYYIRVIDRHQEAGSDYTYDLRVSSWIVENLGTLDAINTSITRAGAGPVAAAGDEFWFVSTVDQAAEITGTFTPTAIWNLDFEIYNTDVQRIDLFASEGDGEAETLRGISAAGTYLFRAYESGMDAGDATYTFDIDFTYEEVRQEVEPNGSEADAQEIVLDYNGVGELANLDSEFDEDYYSFTLTADVAVTAETYPELGGSVDTMLWIYAPGFTPADDNPFCDTAECLAYNDDGGEGLFSLIDGVLLTAGTYYLRVRTFALGSNGYYGLRVSATEVICNSGETRCSTVDVNILETCNAGGTAWDESTCLHGCDDSSGTAVCGSTPVDETEPNDDLANADVISFPYFGSGQITLNDMDYYMFTLPSDGIVVIETDVFADDPVIVDTRLRLYASDGTTQLEYDDDDGNGRYSYIEISLTAGDYYVFINAWSSQVGFYTLSVSF
ncbi:MAG: pre-peptidase C-terminal domain-containing protein [Deltaproteobacteria bacterium]|nr:pre-peptidase C-terminal domain-containing protein [Deltaproteobacteria bacterium]